MMKNKRYALIVLLLIAVFIQYGCGNSGENSGSSSQVENSPEDSSGQVSVMSADDSSDSVSDDSVSGKTEKSAPESSVPSPDTDDDLVRGEPVSISDPENKYFVSRLPENEKKLFSVIYNSAAGSESKAEFSEPVS